VNPSCDRPLSSTRLSNQEHRHGIVCQFLYEGFHPFHCGIYRINKRELHRGFLCRGWQTRILLLKSSVLATAQRKKEIAARRSQHGLGHSSWIPLDDRIYPADRMFSDTCEQRSTSKRRCKSTSTRIKEKIFSHYSVAFGRLTERHEPPFCPKLLTFNAVNAVNCLLKRRCRVERNYPFLPQGSLSSFQLTADVRFPAETSPQPPT
jgi:hypothetical protein